MKSNVSNPNDYYQSLFEDKLFLGADFSIRLGCLHVLTDSWETADKISANRKLLKQKLLETRSSEQIDGVFIDGWDGSRFHTIRLNDKEPLPSKRPFDVTPSMTIFDIICIGRVTKNPTILMEDQGLGHEMRVVYSNLDENGKPSGKWYGVVQQNAGDALINLSPFTQVITRRGTKYRLVQFVQGPVRPSYDRRG